MREIDEAYILWAKTLTPEELAYVFSDKFCFDDEPNLVMAIKKHLRTEEQRKLMYEHDLSIEDMLNGRVIVSSPAYEAQRQILKDWNAKIGHSYFQYFD